MSVADIIRAVEGPLADVRGESPDQLSYVGPAKPLEQVWVATRASVRNVLEQVTLADIATDQPAAEGHQAPRRSRGLVPPLNADTVPGRSHPSGRVAGGVGQSAERKRVFDSV